MINNGYNRWGIDKTLFVTNDKGKLIIIQIYVDDIVFGGMLNAMVENFIQQMQFEFEMSLVGEVTYSIGIQVNQMENNIFSNQVC